MKKQIVIIGGGPAGLAAAVAAHKNGIPADEILILERDRYAGGILNQCIHAGFGLHRFGEELTGPEYAARFLKEVNERRIEILTEAMVLSVTEDKKITFVSPLAGLVTVEAGAVILAMGCRERNRGALNIPGSRPAGIYTAGTAQRYVNIDGYLPGKKVVILGSGDIGLIMARRLTLEGAKVLCVCEIMPYSGGLARNIVQCLEDFDIPLKLSHTVTEIRGKDRLEGVTVSQVDEENGRKPIPGTEEYFECDTLLLSCGLIPENELTLGAGIRMDPVTGGAAVNQYRETSVSGIYACGNVLHVHDLVDYVSDEAETAGAAAAAFIKGTSAAGKTVELKAGFGVRYTVPQTAVCTDEKADVRIFFRVRDVYRKVTFSVTDEAGNVLLRKKKAAAAPGEMESLSIPMEALKNAAGAVTIALQTL